MENHLRLYFFHKLNNDEWTYTYALFLRSDRVHLIRTIKRRHRWFSSQWHKTTTTRELFIWGCSLITQKISGQSLLLGTFAAFYVISQSPSKKKKPPWLFSLPPLPPSHTHPSNTFHLLTVRVDEPHQKQGAMKSGLITPIQEQTRESLRHVVSGSSARQDYCPLRHDQSQVVLYLDSLQLFVCIFCEAWG